MIDVSTSTPGSYTVTYTTSGSCPTSSNVSVTINSLDDSGFNYSASSYCLDATDPSPTITGLGGGMFSSSPSGLSLNAGSGLIDVSTSTPGSYTVTYTTSGGCPNSSNVGFIVNELPIAYAGLDAASCFGASTILSASASGGLAPYTYSWPSGSVKSDTSVSPVINTTYTVTVTDNNGCVDVDDVLVELLAKPIAFAATNGPVCEGTEAKLIAVGGRGYKWFKPNGTYLSNLKEVSFIASSVDTGTYKLVVSNLDGCKDTTVTNLAIKASKPGGFEDVTACDTYTWDVNGTTYDMPGMYFYSTAGASSCNEDTLNLTLTYSSHDTLNVDACERYISNSGIVYTMSGTYKEVFESSLGCDSVEVIKVLIGSVPFIQKETVCGSYTWAANGIKYSESGFYTYNTNPDTLICSNVLALDLFVYPTVAPNILKVENVLTADGTDAIAYFWLDCETNKLVNGEFSPSFTVQKTGVYAVVTVNSNGCPDTSACESVNLTGINQQENTVDFSLHPNPTSGLVQVRVAEFKKKMLIRVTDIAGKQVKLIAVNEATTLIDLRANENGVYFISIESEGMLPIVKRVVKF